MTQSRNGRYFIFGLLYFVQGAMLAYVLIFNNLYLRAFGATAGQLSLLNGLLVLPFILKIGIGVLSDKVGFDNPFLGRGHRIPYMRLGLILIVIGGSAAAFIPPVEMYPLYLVTAFFIAMGLAVYDTTTDGLAIDVTPAHEQAQVQGAMVIGRALGMVALASIYGRLIEAVGWNIVFWIVISFALLPHLVLWRLQEPAQRSQAQAFSWKAIQHLWRPEMVRFSLYAILYAFCVYGANAIVTLFANEELGSTLVQVGDVAAIGAIGMMIGGIAATLLARKVPLWTQGLWTAGAVSIALLLMGLVTTLDNILFITILWGACLSANEFIYITLAMKKSDRRMGAGQFAIFMAISNVGVAAGQAVTTGLIDTLDFHWLFSGLAIINLLAFPLMAAMRGDDEPVTGEAGDLRLEIE